MVREEVDSVKGDGIERVLVCITSQINSERLIDKAADLADTQGAELHILHVQRGDSIFNNSETPKMVSMLCQYGSERGGSIHFYCDEDIAQCIGKFVSEKHITEIVIGQPPVKDIRDLRELKRAASKVLHEVKEPVEVIVVPRDDDKDNVHIFLNADISLSV